MRSSPILIRDITPAPMITQRGVVWILWLCLAVLATNAVLIQTVFTEESPIKNIVRVGVLLLVLIAIAGSNSRVGLGIYLLISLSALYLMLTQNLDHLSYIFIFILAIGLCAIPEKRVEKHILVASFLSLGLVFAFLALGITTNTVTDFRNRMTFGTDGVSFFYNLVYGAFAMLVYYTSKHRHKLRGLILVGSLAATTVLYQLTDARGGYASFLIFVVCLYTIRPLSKIPLVRGVVIALPLILLAATYYFVSFAEDGRVNRIFSYRPRLYAEFLERVEPYDMLTSISVKQIGITVDTSYFHLLYGGGILISVLVYAMYAQAVHNMFKGERFPEIAFVIATLAYFTQESILLRIENMFIIFFWYLLIRHTNPLVTGQQMYVEPPAAEPEKPEAPRTAKKRAYQSPQDRRDAELREFMKAKKARPSPR